MCPDLSVLWSFGINDGRLKNCVTDTLHIPHCPDPRSSLTAKQSLWKSGRGEAGVGAGVGVGFVLGFCQADTKAKSATNWPAN